VDEVSEAKSAIRRSAGFNVGRRYATRAEFMASDDSNSKAGMLFDGAGNER
jgi:hypothetical protein